MLSSAEVLAALRKRHGCEGAQSDAWVCVEEALSGYSGGGGGIDMLALGVWQTAKALGCPGSGKGEARHPMVCYEVKVSRGDMRRELYGYEGKAAGFRRRGSTPKWPNKALRALQISNYFFFAVPTGMMKPVEWTRREPQQDRSLWLPPECGLIEVDGAGCHVRVPAPQRVRARELTRQEVGELVRYAQTRAAREAERRVLRARAA